MSIVPVTETKPAQTAVAITWGRQMNVRDSGRMTDVLAPLGYAPVDSADGADMVILNTCHIRDKAAEKVFSELGRLRRLKEATNGRMILAVAGCVAQAEGKEILTRAPYVDIVLGPQTYHRLPEMVARGGAGRGARDRNRLPCRGQVFDFLPEQSAPQGVTAFLTVQEGCDKFCSFCVVLAHSRHRAELARCRGARRGAAADRPRIEGGHVTGTERECLAWDGTRRRNLGPGPAVARDGTAAGTMAAALRDLASARHG